MNKRIVKYYGGTMRVEPTDSQFVNQWNLDNDDVDDQVDIDAPEAWAIEAGDSNVVIGIIDLGTMVDVSPVGIESQTYKLHPDNTFFFNDDEDFPPKGSVGVDDLDGLDGADPDTLRDNVIGFRFADIPHTVIDTIEKRFWKSVPHNWDNPYGKHGVHVASIAAAKAIGGNNIAGVANKCKVYTVRDGGDPSSQVQEAMAIIHAADVSQVINMSWSFQGTVVEDFLDALGYAIAKDRVLVGSAGNLSQGTGTTVGYPALYDGVLCVGNMSSSLVIDSDSRFGPDVGIVDLVAPVGAGIPVNSHNDCPFQQPGCSQYQVVLANFTGTSAAAPQATGVAALVRSRFPGLTQDQVRQRMKASAEWYWSSTSADSMMYGSGKLNAYRALSEWGSVNGAVTWTKNPLPPDYIQGAWVSRPGSRDGKYYVSGDLTIEAGATLTIDAETIVNIAPDHEQSGADPDHVQIIVKGTLNINGTVDKPVYIQSFVEGTVGSGDWIGIKFEAGSSGNLSNVIIKNASRAIENYAAITLTNVTITGSSQAIDVHANLTANNTLIANNGPASTAVDVQAGTATFTKCTFANNSGAAVAARAGSAHVFDKCIVAFNGGPAVRALGGTASTESSVLFGNVQETGSLTDAQWVSTGQNVVNQDPAFCNSAGGDYRLYAFSLAAPAATVPPIFTERIGARDVGCVPPGTVTTTATATPVAACPAGDFVMDLVLAIDLDGPNGTVMTRDVSPNEIRLDIQDLNAKVFESDGVLSAGAAATAVNGYTTTIQHKAFGSCSGADAVDVLLNGFALAAQPIVNIRTPDLAPAYGVVNVFDFAVFADGYPVNPAVNDCRDYNNDGQVETTDFVFYAGHNEHSSPYSPANAPSQAMQSNAGIALRFTEEYPTATTHRLYVDVDVENFAGVTTSLFAMAAGNERLTFVEWRRAESPLGTVIFAPMVRDGEPQLYFGTAASESFTGSTSRLGQLVFDVAGTEPFEVTEDDFVLTAGEVLLESAGPGLVAAQMGGVFGRAFDPTVARIYHNRLEQNFPNPFNPSTTLAFSLKDAADVSLTIYDVAGRRVRELVNERRDRGAYKVTWDGQNDAGQIVASGVYFYKLTAGLFTETKKMTILK